MFEIIYFLPDIFLKYLFVIFFRDISLRSIGSDRFRSQDR